MEIFDDDELKIPVDWENMYKKLNKADSTTTDPVYDEYGEIIEDGHDTVKYKSFTSDDYYKIHLKEFWYIDSKDTRMKVRIVSLALVDENCKEIDGDMECNPTIRFWIPMNDMRVRNIFARTNAYDLYNNNAERSYDEIFITRYFDSFVTRETNTHNRAVHDYLTGEDAQLESQSIEERIFDIESDMWEY
jgi:gliding motility associated protien GldN